MLKKLTVRNFKSLADVTVEFAPLTVLFGPNASGKSNLLDALMALSAVGVAPTLSDALDEPLPVRGYALEAFTFPRGGLPALFEQERAHFTLEADLNVGGVGYRYRVEPTMELSSGRLGIAEEYLSALTRAGKPKGRPAIERMDGVFRVRRKGRSGRPREVPTGVNHSVLSDRSLAGDEYEVLDAVRSEIGNWRAHYLDPVLTMRRPRLPADVVDIGMFGESIAPFLYKLQAAEPKRFTAIFRALRTLIPSVESLEVRLDQHRGMLDIVIRQAGVEYSSRVTSDGTLRVLALCAIAANPWSGSLIAFEEPENGVHPRRLDLIAELLISLAARRGRQVVVTTHSPRFCETVLRRAPEKTDTVGLFNIHQRDGSTNVRPINMESPLFHQMEVERGLMSAQEDGYFDDGFLDELVLRGLADE